MFRRAMCGGDEVDAETFMTAVAGVVFGVVGFAPLFAVELFVRKGRIRPTVGKGMAALAVSFVFLMSGLSAAWVYMPRKILVVTAGALFGFFAMWAVLAARSMSH